MPSPPDMGVKMEAKMLENRQLHEQGIISVFSALEWVEAFIIDRKSRGLSPNTIIFYQKKMKKFLKYCEINQIFDIQGVRASHIRKFLLWLEDRGHNRGGRATFNNCIRIDQLHDRLAIGIVKYSKCAINRFRVQ
jgi:hypothetical protein